MSPEPLRTIVVEDERLVREELVRQLARMPGIELVGEAADCDTARALLRDREPVLAFLDIELAGGSGFDLLASAPAGLRTIVVSAYEAHALRAFEVSAVDYLLKPVHPERLETALAKVKGTLAGSEAARELPLGYDDHLFLALTGGRTTFLPVGNVVAVVAEGDYTRVHCVDGLEHRVPKPLRHWQARLPQQAFVRIHRSVIVNVRRVRRVDAWLNHRFRVVVEALPKPLMMSRRYAQALKHRCG